MTSDLRDEPNPGSARQRPAAQQVGSSRRAALIATAIALPITVVLAFFFTAAKATKTTSAKPLPAVTVPAPPTPSDAVTAACTKVFEKLPVQLGNLNPRKTSSDSGFVAAWGNPAVIIRCGVSKPSAYGNPSAPGLVGIGTGAADVLWQPDPKKTDTVYTTVDRGGIYVEVTVPPDQQPLPLLGPAISALPATCTGTDAAGNGVSGLPICKG